MKSFIEAKNVVTHAGIEPTTNNYELFVIPFN